MRKVLIVAIVVLSLILAGLIGFIVYDMTHFTVDGEKLCIVCQRTGFE